MSVDLDNPRCECEDYHAMLVSVLKQRNEAEAALRERDDAMDTAKDREREIQRLERLNETLSEMVKDLNARVNGAPIQMRLPCPACGELHVDEGVFAAKIHHTHACQSCGMVWRPAVEPTCGVRFLPGYKNPVEPRETP